MRTSWGYQAFKWIGDRIVDFVNFVDYGAEFVFGEAYVDHYFAMKVGQVSYLGYVDMPDYNTYLKTVILAIIMVRCILILDHASHYLLLCLCIDSDSLGSDTGSDC